MCLKLHEVNLTVGFLCSVRLLEANMGGDLGFILNIYNTSYKGTCFAFCFSVESELLNKGPIKWQSKIEKVGKLERPQLTQ